MILGAVVVGLLVFYWFGTRPALTAAGVTFGVLFAAALLPALTWWLHGALALAVGGVCLVGPRLANPAHAARLTRWSRRAVKLVKHQLKRDKPER